MKIGILGYGEIGQAIEKVYLQNNINPLIKDLNRNDHIEKSNILNVCIPFSEKFIDIVAEEAKNINCVIIHSTISLNTVKELKKNHLKNHIIAHSPVRGIHPNLYEGIMTFEKLVGAETKEERDFVSDHLQSLGIKTITCDSNTSILSKLLSTTYYGLCIAFHAEAKKMCEKYNIDFDIAITKANETYNEGYKKLNKSNVIRPVLYPPKKNIGGHCVISNAEILKDFFESEILDLILKYK